MIKTLIFDFGDVFINLDKPATERELKKLGVEVLTDELLAIVKKYETGEISTQSLIEKAKSFYPWISKTNFIRVWNAIILDFPEYRLKFIEALARKKQFRLILLSNTNELHIEQVIENMKPERFARFKYCFHKFYLSHEIGLRKPDPSFFKFVLEENKLKADECLFIDDTKEHTVSASNLGIHVWHLDPNHDDVIQLFDSKKTNW